VEIQQEREEFERNLREREAWMAEEDRRDQARRQRDAKHRDEVLADVETRARERRVRRDRTLAEGVASLQSTVTDLERLRAVRERKRQELVAAGVDPRYTVELARYDPEKNIRRD